MTGVQTCALPILRVESTDEVDAAIEKANGINDRPVVIEFRTDAREKVFPMVPAGKGNSEVMVDPSQQAELARIRALGL